MPTVDKPLFLYIQRRDFLKSGLTLAGALSALGFRPTSFAADGEAQISPPQGLDIAGEAEVVEIVDGDTVLLSTGQEIRLVGIQAPKIPLSRSNFWPWPHGEEAKDALDSLIRNERVRFGYAGAKQDRHGRGLAHLVRTDGMWVQGWMLRHGHARVYSFPDNRRFVPEMMEIEQAARAAAVGLWALDFYAVRSALDQRIGPLNYFQLVQGTVTQSTRVSNRWFINFGADYRQDFTANLRLDTVRRFRDALSYLTDLEGRSIRVRGWLYERNGPAIDVTHPEQIELLG
ncbi:MAG: thermonuclease family protein [Pseudomonadota bacterium]